MPGTLPEEFGRYRILRELGRGGMGTVYLAEDTRLCRQVALKVPHFSADEDPRRIERFYREARLAGQIQHLNLCPVFDVDCHEGIHFLTMAVIEGTPLSQRIRTEPGCTPREAVGIVRQLAGVLHLLHERGIIHRDLKPDNVLLQADGTPVLMDFGLARTLSTGERLTSLGKPMGTPAYMAPEQITGNDAAIGPCTDIWALGVILYQLLTGQLPFRGTISEVTVRILGMMPPPPSEHHPDIPATLDSACLLALAKMPRQRPKTMQRFAQLLHLPAEPLVHTLLTTSPGTRAGLRILPLPEVELSAGQPRKVTLRVERYNCPGEIKLALRKRCRGVRLELPSISPESDLVELQIEAEPSARGNGELALIAETSDHVHATAQLRIRVREPLPARLVNSIGMELALIPAGKFLMGSPANEPGRAANEGPQHEVEITRSFYLGIYPVTQAEYEVVRGTNPSNFQCGGPFEQRVEGLDTRHFPVENVTWNDAVLFCEALSGEPAEKKAGRVYRLPTEAEWEYACRGGSATYEIFHVGDSLSALEANIDGRSGHDRSPVGPFLQRPSPVGAYEMPNGFGLHDMHGNVWEWCNDRYRENYYQLCVESHIRHDPQGPDKGTRRVLRGGAWSLGARNSRSAARTDFDPRQRNFITGFRVVCIVMQRS